MNRFFLYSPSACVLCAIVCCSGAAAEPRLAPASSLDSRDVVANAWLKKFEFELALDNALPGIVRKFDAGGKLVGADRTYVRFYRAGRLVASVRTDEGGHFQAKIPAGVYSVVAGDLGDQKGFAAVMVQILPYTERPPIRYPSSAANAPDTRSRLPSQASPVYVSPRAQVLEIALAPAGDIRLLRSIIATRIATAPKGLAENNMRSLQGRADLATLLSTAPVVRDAASATAGPTIFRAAASDAVVTRRSRTLDQPIYVKHFYPLQPDKSLQGRLRTYDRADVSQPVAGAEVFLVRDARYQAQGRSDNLGSYRTSSLTSGVYSLFVLTPFGFGATGVRLGEPEELPQDSLEIKAAAAGAFRKASLLLDNADESTNDQESADTTVIDSDDTQTVLATPDITTPRTTPVAGAPGTNMASGAAGGGGTDPATAALLGGVAGAVGGYLLGEALASDN